MQFTPESGLPRAPLLRRTCKGLLFVGDPHMTCVRPGRRIEENFLEVVLDKIRQAREIAEQNDLFMIFPGDLTDNAGQKKDHTNKVVEDPNLMIPGFAQAMNFRESMTLPGNHDLEEVSVTANTTLGALHRLKLIHLMEPAGPFAIFDIDGQKVGVGGTPYGKAIPPDVRGAFDESVDKVVWVTHSLFVFDQKIPGLSDPPEILGCDMVVNGHDHTTQKSRQIGCTEWHNIGNITRLKVDAANHVPSVWQWDPVNGMKQHVLRYNKHAFNMEGLQVQPDEKAALQAEKRRTSVFSTMLVNSKMGDMARSDSGDLLETDVDAVIARRSAAGQMSELAAATLKNLLQRAPEKIKGP